MRMLGVSLVALAAVAASFTLARQRGHPRPLLLASPDGSPTPSNLDLNAIRAAGW